MNGIAQTMFLCRRCDQEFPGDAVPYAVVRPSALKHSPAPREHECPAERADDDTLIRRYGIGDYVGLDVPEIPPAAATLPLPEPDTPADPRYHVG